MENMRRAKQGGSGLVREFSPAYYGLCAAGGMLSAGTTHLAITPLDVLKVNMQVLFVCFFLFFLVSCLDHQHIFSLLFYFLLLGSFLCFSDCTA